MIDDTDVAVEMLGGGEVIQLAGLMKLLTKLWIDLLLRITR